MEKKEASSVAQSNAANGAVARISKKKVAIAERRSKKKVAPASIRNARALSYTFKNLVIRPERMGPEKLCVIRMRSHMRLKDIEKLCKESGSPGVVNGKVRPNGGKEDEYMDMSVYAKDAGNAPNYASLLELVVSVDAESGLEFANVLVQTSLVNLEEVC
jgi:hypothetical protein